LLPAKEDSVDFLYFLKVHLKNKLVVNGLRATAEEVQSFGMLFDISLSPSLQAIEDDIMEKRKAAEELELKKKQEERKSARDQRAKNRHEKTVKAALAKIKKRTTKKKNENEAAKYKKMRREGKPQWDINVKPPTEEWKKSSVSICYNIRSLVDFFMFKKNVTVPNWDNVSNELTDGAKMLCRVIFHFDESDFSSVDTFQENLASWLHPSMRPQFHEYMISLHLILTADMIENHDRQQLDRFVTMFTNKITPTKDKERFNDIIERIQNIEDGMDEDMLSDDDEDDMEEDNGEKEMVMVVDPEDDELSEVKGASKPKGNTAILSDDDKSNGETTNAATHTTDETDVAATLASFGVESV
jgi:hypothetical protein